MPAICIRVALVFAILAGLATQGLAATYYVRAAGNDTLDGLSASNAFKTIRRAAQVATNGDTVHVGGGTYSDDVFVDGIQQSTSVIEFHADTTGSFTGDSGTVTIDGQLAVVNSNSVKFSGFTFSGSADRSLLWDGSYDGIIEHCTFSSGADALLIKGGSLTIDNCTLQLFSQDGIQIDGEADLTISNSSITGAAGNAIAILKTSKVTLNNTNLTSSSSAGIAVAVSATSLPTGGLAPPCVGISSINMEGLIDSYDSTVGYSGPPGTNSASVYSNGSYDTEDGYIYGNAYRTSGNHVSSGDVSGSVFELSRPLSCAPVDVQNAATVNNNASIPLTDYGNSALSAGAFTLNSGDGVSLPAGVYYFSSMTLNSGSQLRISGPTSIYCNGSVSVTGGNVNTVTQNPALLTLYPLQGNCTFSGGSNIYGAVYGPNANITVGSNSQISGIAIGNTLTLTSSARIHLDQSLSGLAGLLYRKGNAVVSSPSPPATWTAISSGEVSVLNSTLDGNFSGVVLQDPCDFVATASTIQNSTEWGLRLKGTCQVDGCTIQNNSIGGIELDGMVDADTQITNLTLANNSQYGVYGSNSTLTVTASDAWSLSGGDHGFAFYNGQLTLNGLSISGPSTACVLADNSTLTVQSCTISGGTCGISSTACTALIEDSTLTLSSVGLYSNQDDSMLTRNTLLHNNSVWGAVVTASSAVGATATLDGCTVYDNAGGVSVTGAQDGDFHLLNTVIRDNSQTGIDFQSCTLTLDEQATDIWQSLRNLYAMSASSSVITLNGVTLSDATSFVIVSLGSTFNIQNCTLTGGQGFYQTGAGASTISETRIECSSTPGTSWGIWRNQGDITISNTVVCDFANGIYVASSQVGDQADLTNVTVAQATGYGIYVGSGDTDVTNSILAGNSGSIGLYKATGNLTHATNLVHGFATTHSGTSASATDVLEPPRFADVATRDYRLAVGSPAINSGQDVSAVLSADLEGNARPSFGAFEIGAYEFTGSAGSFSVLDWTETE